MSEKDIYITDGNYVNVEGFGTVGLWWPKYDKKVCIDHSIGESFYAKTREEVVQGILRIFNDKKKT